MKFRCPYCPGVCGLLDRTCPHCGSALDARSVLHFYFVRARELTALQCPRCRQGALPIGTKVCPVCGETPTLQDVVEATVGPPRRRLRQYLRNASPKTKGLAQWIYCFLSAMLLWWLLGYVQRATGGAWLGAALLSIFYLIAIGFYTVWLMPRWVVITISRRASGLVKFSLSLNFFAGMLVLQLLIRAWWERAIILAGLFVVIWFAVRLLNRRVLPEAEALWSIFLGPGDQFDPTSPQGRSARME